MGKAPSAPNPTATAQAQTASNRETAVAQAGLNAVDQRTPYGNLTYTQQGTWADGTPKFTATQTLSGAGQQLFDTGQQTQQNLANLAQEQSGRLSGLLNQPLDWSAQQGYLNDLTAQNLNPQWDRMAEQNEQSLVNRGLRPGSTAYNDAQDQFLQSRSSAFNNANLNNFNSALQSQMTLRNQPLNEILALAGQSQIQQPSFMNTPQTGVAGTDVAGITQNAYNTQLQGYNSMMGGLGSAGAGLLAAPTTSILGGLFGLSDRKAKKDIRRIGTAFNGVPLYMYRYTDDDSRWHVGPMAQEVKPSAVELRDDGYLYVDYAEAFA